LTEKHLKIVCIMPADNHSHSVCSETL